MEEHTKYKTLVVAGMTVACLAAFLALIVLSAFGAAGANTIIMSEYDDSGFYYQSHIAAMGISFIGAMYNLSFLYIGVFIWMLWAIVVFPLLADDVVSLLTRLKKWILYRIVLPSFPRE